MNGVSPRMQADLAAAKAAHQAAQQAAQQAALVPEPAVVAPEPVAVPAPPQPAPFAWLFSHVRDNDGAPHAGNFETFAATVQASVRDCTVPDPPSWDEKAINTAKCELPAFGPYVLTGKRSNDNVERVNVLSWDVDDDPNAGVLFEKIRARGLRGFAYESPSSGIKGTHPRYRLVLQPERPLAPGEALAVKATIAADLGIPFDARAERVSQIAFVGRFAGTRARQWIDFPGKPVAIPAVSTLPDRVAQIRAQPDAPLARDGGGEMQALIEKLAGLLPVDDGKQAWMLQFLGWCLKKGWAHQDLKELLEQCALRTTNFDEKYHEMLTRENSDGSPYLKPVDGPPGVLREHVNFTAIDAAVNAHPTRRGLLDAVAGIVKDAAPTAPAQASGIGARLRHQVSLGPRHATGFASLDAALRGGLQVEKMLVIGGAPGAGKTSKAVQIGSHFSRTGVAVGWLAADEEASGIDARRLQAIGVLRRFAEEPDAATIARAETELAPLPFDVYDECTVEAAALALAQRYPNQPRCLIVDSVQTARTATSDTLEPRARIDEVLKTLKRISRDPSTRCIVIVTSELARASYRSEDSADAVSDLAAFKESGGIEYAGHVLLVLRSAKGGDGLVSVSMPKNRIGPKKNYTLKQDFMTCTFRELTESVQETREKQQAADDRAKVLDAVTRHPGSTTTQVTQHSGIAAQRVAPTLVALRQSGHVRSENRGKAVLHWPQDPADAARAPFNPGPSGLPLGAFLGGVTPE